MAVCLEDLKLGDTGPRGFTWAWSWPAALGPS